MSSDATPLAEIKDTAPAQSSAVFIMMMMMMIMMMMMMMMMMMGVLSYVVIFAKICASV